RLEHDPWANRSLCLPLRLPDHQPAFGGLTEGLRQPAGPVRLARRPADAARWCRLLVARAASARGPTARSNGAACAGGGGGMRRSLNALFRHPSVFAAVALVLLVAGVWGIAASRASTSQTLDQRVRAVASQIQCPVCHGESVADSPSAIADEMRALIRQQLTAGMSEQQILQYFRDRYGDGILETPPMQGFNAF